MKRKISTYIKNFYKEIKESEEKQISFSEFSTGFDQRKHFQKIAEQIDSEKQHRPVIPIYKRKWFLAASFVGILFISYHFYDINFSKSESIVWENKTSPIDGTDSVVLEDGTKVWLNVNSSLKYPKHFNGRTREVTLNGEAFFEVKHNPRKPFIIHTENINTTVLGTSFDVNAYQDNSIIDVTVNTGKVKVNDAFNSKSDHILIPKQQVSFGKIDKQFSIKQNVDINSSIGWQNGNLIFEDKALKDILPLLNKKFNTAINTDSSLVHAQITANFEGESLDDILQAISAIVDANIEKQKNTYLLKKIEK